MKHVFIDGQQGTTGLQILDRLKSNQNIKLVFIPEKSRKDKRVKAEIMNQNADLVILCLPDQAAQESVLLIENPVVKILDASTAHRVDPDWAYGLAEVKAGQREKIKTSQKVSNPGCYPTGVILTLRPLIESQLIAREFPCIVHAVSGYSGGGKSLIEKYEARASQEKSSWAYRPYALDFNHKHLPEMTKYSGLSREPHFSPAVANFPTGMLTHIPFFDSSFLSKVTGNDLYDCLSDYYVNEKLIVVHKPNESQEQGEVFLASQTQNSDQVHLFIFGRDTHLSIIAAYDNLGKGASGAAIQNMNLMLGFPETSSLFLT